MNESDTRAKLVDPALKESRWTEDMIEGDRYITSGQIVNEDGDRLPKRKPDYILYYPDKSGMPIATIEAEPDYKDPDAGMGQAKEYRRRLDVPFAYSTNGKGIEEYDNFTYKQRAIESYPAPDELWRKYVEGRELGEIPSEREENPLLFPYFPFPDKPIRYYQEVAVKGALEAILNGQDKVLLTMGTGSGKTYVAFQIAWKLWKTGKIKRILFVVDRIFLRRQAFGEFGPFGEARGQLVGTEEILKHKEVYFSTYQTLYSEKDGKKIYEHFDPDFFDLVIIDECHRSGWKRWHDILQHFSSAIHLGMTATPKRDDNVDTYAYFGEPAYDYPLRQGIEDGFLAPCEIMRTFTNVDKEGKLTIAEAKSHGAKVDVPEGVELKDFYTVEEFEKYITLPDRTNEICEHLANIIESVDPTEKTAIFCVTQSHARSVAKELNNHFAPMLGIDNYATSVITDEPYAHSILKEFRRSERKYPVMVTTVDLLSTGVDIPPVRNIVFLKSINSKVVFHQIVGRGSRIDEDSRKYTFRIIDYTNATRLFDDWDLPEEPEAEEEYEGPFDRYLSSRIVDGVMGSGIGNASVVVTPIPGKTVHVKTDEDGSIVLSEMPRRKVKLDVSASGYKKREPRVPTFPTPDQSVTIALEKETGEERRKLVTAENLDVYIAEEGRVKVNAVGNVLTDAEYIEYCKDGMAERVATLDQLKDIWRDKERRRKFKKELEDSGVNLGVLSKLDGKPDVDEFDLIAHLLFDAPFVTRDERARVLLEQQRILEEFKPDVRNVILELVDRYKRYGIGEVTSPGIFRTPPFDKMGALRGLIKTFGGIGEVKKAIEQVETGLYPEFEGR